MKQTLPPWSLSGVLPAALGSAAAAGVNAQAGSAPGTVFRDCPRVLRSGAWSYGPRMLRAADRYGTPPGDRMPLVGFRVVKAVAP